MKKKVDDKLLEKIQKLFQLGTSPNMNEAQAAIKKAKALMEEYDLSYGEVNYTREKRERNGRKIYDWELLIFNAVCYNNNCQPIRNRTRYWGHYAVCGRKINVLLCMEMFNYLTEAVKRIAKEQCRGKGHKYNHDFKMAAADKLETIIYEYGARVSWAVDRDEELENIRKYSKVITVKNDVGADYEYLEDEAILAGISAADGISLHKQAGIEETKLIGAAL